ncbi:MAG: alkaline phosphatase [Methylovulum sp.]|uniref:alkaline phosphatase n=1 Tax=Methylovulum sp. TaxID=1916980 RepID=UPI00262CDB5F|nr:alkaline phosphatase [Methylovulum sp.]MDD2724949.1 alkaline phosphatase [Methylovulum sp.]MDD5123527.1 alkaline phosphatase [Methylovulum sp.]
MKLKLTTIAVAAVLSASTAMVSHASQDSFPAPASDRNTWFAAGKAAVLKNIALKPIVGPAKNVILFIGDGMGISTVTAARILAGQQPGIIDASNTTPGSSGEENSLSFEMFPYLALSKTYSANQQTPDSAPTMTAMVTGVKTLDGVLSVDQGVTRADCATNLKTHKLKTILEQAEIAGKSTGLVSTARITHATPAANYAHTPERDWESDANQPAGCAVPDIARQLIEFPYGNGIEVALGGGREYFRNTTQADPEDAGKFGKRNDGRDLTAEWVTRNGAGSAFIYKQSEFDAIDPSTTTHLLGLFERSHMEYEADRLADTAGEPSLAALTEKSIKILSNNPKGFYLHVEAGRVDHGHHAGNAYRALTDAIALSDAVKKAVDTLTAMGELENTLIIVSADHSHVFTIAGYPQRGNNILGKVINPGSTAYASADDKAPYTTLTYANGRGYHTGVKGDDVYGTPIQIGRFADMTAVDTTDADFHQEAAVPLSAETHAGEDVAIYARGPGAHLFQGTMEQNAIYHVMNRKMSK